jgi:hypothetical protein
MLIAILLFTNETESYSIATLETICPYGEISGSGGDRCEDDCFLRCYTM